MSAANMRKALLVLILLVPVAAFAQYVSYWFQGWQRQGNARDAQEYFMVPGAGIYFTYAPTNRVIINAFTNAPIPGSGPWFSDGTNVWWTNTIPGQVYIGNGSGPHINLYTDGRGNFESNLTTKAKLSSLTLEVSSNAVFGGILYGNGAGLSNVPCTTIGLTITQYMTDFMLGQITNVYSNGLLVVTGLYVIPVTPLLGAGGDALLGAGGDAMTGAGG